MDHLLLDGIPFAVLAATFEDHRDGTISFSIQCDAAPALDSSHRLWGVKPRLYADGAELPIVLDGATARLTAARLPECSISLCVHEHEDLTSCTAVFAMRGDRVNIELRGNATIMGKPVTVAVVADALNRAAPV